MIVLSQLIYSKNVINFMWVQPQANFIFINGIEKLKFKILKESKKKISIIKNQFY